MRRACAVLLAACAVAPAFAATAAAATSGPLTYATHLDPRYAFFGDQITARLDLDFDPRVVRASTVQVDPSFGDWQEVGAPTVDARSDGTLAHQTWRFTIDCLGYPCVPKQPSVQTFKLPPFTISAQTAAGRTVTAAATWPSAEVTARFFPPEVGNVRPALRAETQLAAPLYAIGPGLLAWLLDAVGIVLLVGAAVALAVATRRGLAARRVAAAPSALERALALVREAQGREPDDRRRAVEVLARALGSGDAYERAATEVAWSEREPSAEQLGRLVEEIDATEARR